MRPAEFSACSEMALQCTTRLPYSFPQFKNKFAVSNSIVCLNSLYNCIQRNECRTLSFSFNGSRSHIPKTGNTFAYSRGARRGVEEEEDSSDSDDEDEPVVDKNDPYLMTLEEREEWRRKIREVMVRNLEVKEEVMPEERRKKVQELVDKYPLVVEEDDPDWPEDADGWGFNLGQFFDKITIKNNPKKVDDDDDDDDDSKNEIVWQDDNYIRPIKDITTADWEETVFKDISPLIILVHNRYRRPKENEKIRDEIEKAVHIIWNCRLPSPRCVAVDAVIETDLVSALQVSVFPEMIFTKAGKILYREREMRTADELSKIMAYYYYGAAKPPCLKTVVASEEAIPSVSITAQLMTDGN
ncbi:thioredoxin-like fold domain-containing protein MRL7L, chloroplastic [Cannabis sativa]|uniref:thioredoxin-like fold domain-containing protein MRL7L, chloroplastic n=1 Tax=Cannabis sativa TaxID=3483 RepID=UPI0029CA34E0|nr:thioredoxin-like fold domain-containing protein MRL7L, chloroplastic [Cannabis sativa]